MGKKLAIIFPGVGYTCAKPLLYYTAQLAAEYDYEVIRLDYGMDIHNFKGRTMEDLIPVAVTAKERILAQMKEIDPTKYEDILMISKSIGTVIACKIQEELAWDKKTVRHFWMTPIPLTLPYLESFSGLFVAGTGDPYISKELVEKAALEYPDKTGKIFPGCNHSLEIHGDTKGNIQRVTEVVE
ncbi:MAG: hypothetical protein ACI4TF_09890, partial [Oliverpabstia sp.]